MEAVIPTFHEGLWPRLAETFPMLKFALQSRFAIIRQSAAKCLATICDVMTTEAMRFVIEEIMPLLGDPLVLANRQGAAELVYREYHWQWENSSADGTDRHCSASRHQSITLRAIHDCPYPWPHERFR